MEWPSHSPREKMTAKIYECSKRTMLHTGGVLSSSAAAAGGGGAGEEEEEQQQQQQKQHW